MYIKKASTIILAASVLIWGVMTFPRPPSSSTNPTENNVALRSSIAGQIGTFMEPATSLAGFNWKTNVSLLAGFAAKEIVVSTMGTAYSLENTDKEHTESLTEKLQTDPAWSKASAIALILFTMLYSPCVVTVITIVRETKSILWGAFTIVANTALAYFMAVITYQLLKKLV